MKNIRLLPIVVIAASALFLLKSIGLFVAADYPVNPISPAFAQETAKQDESKEAMENKEAMAAKEGEEKAAESDKTKMADASKADGEDGSIDLTAKPNSETAILQRLGERRTALEKRSSELDLREQLLNATELRIERRVGELKSIEGRIQVAEKKREKKESTRLNGLVQMYEGMKPKDAARVFDRLSLDILVEVVRQIKPRKMSAILAKMSPENAERLTVALATDRTTDTPMAPKGSELPKINGKPTN